MEAFPNLAKKAIRKTIPFLTTYFCKSGFSAMMYMKNKHRSRLQLEDNLRVALSKTEPSFERVVMMKPQQKSIKLRNKTDNELYFKK